jgi:hypothetical protein
MQEETLNLDGAKTGELCPFFDLKPFVELAVETVATPSFSRSSMER